MRQTQLFNLNTIIADGLEEIKSLKNLAVGLQQYEETAKLRDIEKTFLQLEDELSKGLFPILTNTVTENTQHYFDQVFAYCYFQDWKNISAHFNHALKNRKEQLNKIFQPSDDQKNQLVSVNSKFSKLEESILEVYETREVLKTIRSFKPFFNAFEPGTITIQCHSNNSSYTFLNNQDEKHKYFYQFEMSVELFISELNAYKNDRDPKYRKIKDLVMDELNSKGFDQDICAMFLLFVSGGYLAWEDVLNIEEVGISTTINYINC